MSGIPDDADDDSEQARLIVSPQTLWLPQASAVVGAFDVCDLMRVIYTLYLKVVERK